MARSLENQDISEKIVLSGEDVVLGTFTPIYPLRDAEYERIRRGKPKLFDLAAAAFAATFGYALSLTPEYLRPGSSEITTEALAPLGLGIGLSILIYCLGLALPNKRRETLKKIENHFKTATSTTQVQRK